jgi:hypothetical protein
MKLLRSCGFQQIARGNYLRLNLLLVNALSITPWYYAGYRKVWTNAYLIRAQADHPAPSKEILAVAPIGDMVNGFRCCWLGWPAGR